MSRRSRAWVACGALALIALLASSFAFAYDWLQFNGSAAHSGNNQLENQVNATNVGQLSLLFQVSLFPGDVEDGAPVFLDSVSTPAGVQSLPFVTTRNGYIIALNAQTGAQVWSHQNGPGTCKINKGSGTCYTTSSPAIGPLRGFVYSYGLDGKVHKYNAATGAEFATGGWPATTTLKAFDEKASSPLAIATVGGVNYLYVVHGGYPGDNGDYQGHLTAINMGTGATKVFNVMCSNQAVAFVETPGTPDCATGIGSAIWGRSSAVYDAGTGHLFIATGNATQGTKWNGTTNWSESVLELTPAGAGTAMGPLDSYTPADYQSLDDGDADVGSTSLAILPVPASSAVQHLGLQGGKDSILRLLDLTNLSGQGGPGHTGGEVNTANVPQGDEVVSQPAVWVNPADGSTWVFVGNTSGLSGLQLQFDGSGNPSLVEQWQLTSQWAHSSPLVANNVLFFHGSVSGGDELAAYAPTTGNLLWSTSQVGGTHWESPIVANGTVYVTDESGQLSAFSLSGVSPTTTALASSANPSVVGSSVTFTATVTGSAPTGSVAFTADGVAISGCNAVALAASSAACSTSSLVVGLHSIVASYGGDASNQPSTSSTLSQQVNSLPNVNVALAANGGVASASSTFVATGYSFPVSAVNDGDRAGLNWGHGGGWNSATANLFPDWVQINFSGPQSIDEVILYTLQDDYTNPVDPPDNQTFSLYGVTAFQVQGWNGSAWVNLGPAVSGNNLVKRPVSFPSYTTDRIRVNITAALDSYARVVEIEAWTPSGTSGGATTTTLSSSRNPSQKGRHVTFSANVTGSNPTGTVNFTDGGTSISGCAAAVLAGDAASCSTSSLGVGTHSIVATYSGDASNLGSVSAPLSQVVTH